MNIKINHAINKITVSVQEVNLGVLFEQLNILLPNGLWKSYSLNIVNYMSSNTTPPQIVNFGNPNKPYWEVECKK